MRLSTSIAHTAHDSINHVRKFSGKPYWEHTDAVREIVSRYTDDDVVLDIADLHDMHEDVFPVNPAFGLHTIYQQFTPLHAFVASEVTNRFDKHLIPGLNRAQRHELESMRFQYVSWRGLMVKEADLMENTSDIAVNDKDFAVVYFREKLKVLHYVLKNPEHAKELNEWKLFGATVEALFSVAGTLGTDYWTDFKAEAERLKVVPYGDVVKA
jgi:(p)ppGpp synthase/HD superfamily hydrolase